MTEQQTNQPNQLKEGIKLHGADYLLLLTAISSVLTIWGDDALYFIDRIAYSVGTFLEKVDYIIPDICNLGIAVISLAAFNFRVGKQAIKTTQFRLLMDNLKNFLKRKDSDTP